MNGEAPHKPPPAVLKLGSCVWERRCMRAGAMASVGTAAPTTPQPKETEHLMGLGGGEERRLPVPC